MMTDFKKTTIAQGPVRASDGSYLTGSTGPTKIDQSSQMEFVNTTSSETEFRSDCFHLGMTVYWDTDSARVEPWTHSAAKKNYPPLGIVVATYGSAAAGHWRIVVQVQGVVDLSTFAYWNDQSVEDYVVFGDSANSGAQLQFVGGVLYYSFQLNYRWKYGSDWASQVATRGFAQGAYNQGAWLHPGLALGREQVEDYAQNLEQADGTFEHSYLQTYPAGVLVTGTHLLLTGPATWRSLSSVHPTGWDPSELNDIEAVRTGQLDVHLLQTGLTHITAKHYNSSDADLDIGGGAENTRVIASKKVQFRTTINAADDLATFFSEADATYAEGWGRAKGALTLAGPLECNRLIVGRIDYNQITFVQEGGSQAILINQTGEILAGQSPATVSLVAFDGGTARYVTDFRGGARDDKQAHQFYVGFDSVVNANQAGNYAIKTFETGWLNPEGSLIANTNPLGAHVFGDLYLSPNLSPGGASNSATGSIVLAHGGKIQGRSNDYTTWFAADADSGLTDLISYNKAVADSALDPLNMHLSEIVFHQNVKIMGSIDILGTGTIDQVSTVAETTKIRAHGVLSSEDSDAMYLLGSSAQGDINEQVLTNMPTDTPRTMAGQGRTNGYQHALYYQQERGLRAPFVTLGRLNVEEWVDGVTVGALQRDRVIDLYDAGTNRRSAVTYTSTGNSIDSLNFEVPVSFASDLLLNDITAPSGDLILSGNDDTDDDVFIKAGRHIELWLDSSSSGPDTSGNVRVRAGTGHTCFDVDESGVLIVGNTGLSDFGQIRAATPGGYGLAFQDSSGDSLLVLEENVQAKVGVAGNSRLNVDYIGHVASGGPSNTALGNDTANLRLYSSGTVFVRNNLYVLGQDSGGTELSNQTTITYPGGTTDSSHQYGSLGQLHSGPLSIRGTYDTPPTGESGDTSTILFKATLARTNTPGEGMYIDFRRTRGKSDAPEPLEGGDKITTMRFRGMCTGDNSYTNSSFIRAGTTGSGAHNTSYIPGKLEFGVYSSDAEHVPLTLYYGAIYVAAPLCSRVGTERLDFSQAQTLEGTSWDSVFYGDTYVNDGNLGTHGRLYLAQGQEHADLTHDETLALGSSYYSHGIYGTNKKQRIRFYSGGSQGPGPVTITGAGDQGGNGLFWFTKNKFVVNELGLKSPGSATGLSFYQSGNSLHFSKDPDGVNIPAGVIEMYAGGYKAATVSGEGWMTSSTDGNGNVAGVVNGIRINGLGDLPRYSVPYNATDSHNYFNCSTASVQADNLRNHWPRGPQCALEIWPSLGSSNAATDLGYQNILLRRSWKVVGGKRVVDGAAWGIRANATATPNLTFSVIAGRHNDAQFPVVGKPMDVKAWISGTVEAGDLDFTGQHRSQVEDPALLEDSSYVGCILEATGEYANLVSADIDPETGESTGFSTHEKPTINEAIPVVRLATGAKNKRVFGVLSDSEDLELGRAPADSEDGPDQKRRTYTLGAFTSCIDVPDDEPDRVHVNSLGEGAMWVCSSEGNLENGDYITTGLVPGLGVKQDDDLLHNYTVAKITQDCDFDLESELYDCEELEFEGETYRRAFVGCTYHCG